LRYSQKSGAGALVRVHEKEIVTLFRWPGMTMALRREFWLKQRSIAKSIDAPHDRVLALLAASSGGMFFLDMPLCSHRLHTSNNGGEVDSAAQVLSCAFKKKELSTSLRWLDAQLSCADVFSSDAQSALKGYREYVSLRLNAIEKRSLWLLPKTLRCKGYIHWKGLASDVLAILRG
ncbi:MAG: hypothetical protein Q4A66_08640, partial [Eubacteriales bacterium]|nr:hypothetical protein [Eubacteriales bacterium]